MSAMDAYEGGLVGPPLDETPTEQEMSRTHHRLLVWMREHGDKSTVYGEWLLRPGNLKELADFIDGE